MSLTRKGRRSIRIDGRDFIWFVAPDSEPYGRPELRVISDDKGFIAAYQLGQPDGTRHVTLIGSEPAGLKEAGPWKRFLCPPFDAEGSVTPASIRSLVTWCMDDAPKTEVDYRGRPVTSGDGGR